MSRLTSRTAALTASTRQSLLRNTQTFTPTIPQRLASGYGDGEGGPKSEKPQDQGANPSADLEHPGPPPPKAGEGSGSSPTKGTAEGHTKPNQTTGSTSQKRSFSTVRSLWAKDMPKSTEGLQPKILSESPPGEEEAPDDVKEHNRDMDNRNAKSHESVSNEDAKKDKVSRAFWAG
ncbi:hypothetical protein EJ08DRAFT_632535 [Tothia fuscella]|uniref:Uncharacterized protein n=1 Tax=Tothia fuscella TaxID=1048955 RepID=A0A9P4NSA1_9PEZI|nr:hypothetical protein EJ08DRAFT_632535 [Tothia fuscella]